jgi:hypothetical protein
MANLTNDERLNLKKMINESECDNNTDNIRRLKHSVLMRDDIRKLDTLSNTYSDMKITNMIEFTGLCQTQCTFLYTNYTDIFHKLIKDELDLTIMTKLLTILKMIEDSKVDQHEGSVMVGKILKEMYVDSATRELDHLNEQRDVDRVNPSEGSNISWSEFKKMKS